MIFKVGDQVVLCRETYDNVTRKGADKPLVKSFSPFLEGEYTIEKVSAGGGAIKIVEDGRSWGHTWWELSLNFRFLEDI